MLGYLFSDLKEAVGARQEIILFILPTPHFPLPQPDFPKVTKPDILLNSRLSHQPDLVVVQCSLPRY
ncbi:MAG: hypothetical protein EWV92_21860 [Microcystis aeruginosa Ma_MB_S_20031200_S102]|uniref:Uncharacterized protein n=1 Tax=Microcystis aeruginosa Ma_MB_S_20031200_S102 TaxID=2486254 RepID=A0A552E829_MICAE|nr:MAG: hypothetical protein EWV79_15645 [Microcystis aeruginosa Ma_MB_S_20031200_S102D]TRU30602.1 MAG: hypothetical protein EWV92_21860 [Microcystis aeruginosa Ma_MB_S_20031200_S102]